MTAQICVCNGPSYIDGDGIERCNECELPKSLPSAFSSLPASPRFQEPEQEPQKAMEKAPKKQRMRRYPGRGYAPGMDPYHVA